MLMTADRQFTAIAPEDLDRIRSLFDAGMYLRAYETARPFGPLGHWQGTEARVFAGRLAGQVGGRRLGMALHYRAWRDDPADPLACYYHARNIFGRRGPLRAWKFLEMVGPLDQAEETVRSDWMATHASVLSRLRDFDAAESWLALAERIAPDRAWLLVERSDVFEQEDRYEEALAAARASLALRPWYRPGVQTTAHLLQLLDRDDEAVALLAEAASRTESGAIVVQLAALQDELGYYADARRSWDRFAELTPLMDAKTRRWLAGRRSDAAYGCGDITASRTFARECGHPFFVALAERLDRPEPDSRRVLLEVPFVRQHHQTCAPATLAAIARFWGKAGDHLAMAEAICYDGTPDHRERSWADENGWLPREFTVTWESAVALLDRGVPFTLTTVETQNAHLQAVIGYDARRGTLLIRDPTLPYSGEAIADAMLTRYRSVGPRGMALVPRERADLLDGLELPDAPSYDLLHELQVALRLHDRDRASRAYDALKIAAPGHRLTRVARQVLAYYDADAAEILAAVEGILELFPDDANLQLGRLSCLRVLGRRDERLALYGDLCRAPEADPLLRRQYARELLADAREHQTVVHLIQWVLRKRPTDAEALTILAEAAWDGRRLDEAVALYRWAACLQEKDEGLARTYFNASRYLHREDEALRFLQGRFQRFASRSAQPARTLYWALAQLDRMSEAFAVLDEALRFRPVDGDLLLFAAEANSSLGEFDRAAERLESARGLCRQGDFLRTAAFLASVRGDLAGSLSLWRQVLDAEPLAPDANRSVARLLAETEGRTAAVAHLNRSCERFPHNYPLHQARIEWLRGDGPEALEPAVRNLLTIHPADAWAQRELALTLSGQKRHEEAEEAMELASQLEPSSTAEASVRAQVLELSGRRVEACAAYREAVRRSVDNEYAINHWIELCDTRAERIEALTFIEAELARQVIFGDGLILFAQQARGMVEPDELLAMLRRAHEARPDLWHAWSALIRDLVNRGDIDEALGLARRASERFPLLPRIWFDLAAVCRAGSDRHGEVEALEHALRISPGWSAPARHLATALEKDGKYRESLAVSQRALAHAPLDPYNHGFVADALWNLGEKESAVDRLIQALRLDASYEWAWNTLRSWTAELERPEVPLNLARELTEQRGGESRTWLMLAKMLSAPDDIEERLTALDRAIALDPRGTEASDYKAQLLAEARRWDEADAACRPSEWREGPPLTLRGRAAWVAARRGDLPNAIAQMRVLVAEEPDYYWGWQNLAEWTCDAGSAADYLEAAEAMVRLASENPIAAGYRGEARLKSGDRAGAKDDFRRAFGLAPDYGFAAFNLFDLELADENLEAAGQALEALKTHNGSEYVLAREVQLAFARNDLPTADQALEQLCMSPNCQSEWPFRTADRAYAQSGWGARAERIYTRTLERSGVNPLVGSFWIERCLARRDWNCERRLGDLLARGEVGVKAANAYFSALAGARKSWKIHAAIHRNRQALRAHTTCWANVGYALLMIERHRLMADWMRDWPDRTDVEPWMLNNLATSLRALGRVDEANRASRRAFELRPDNSNQFHTLWLALDDALDGDRDSASRRLEGLDSKNFDAGDRFFHGLTKLLASLGHSEPSGWRRMFVITTRHGREFVRLSRTAVIPESHGAVVQTYYRAARVLARGYSPIVRSLWELWRRLNPPQKGR